MTIAILAPGYGGPPPPPPGPRRPGRLEELGMPARPITFSTRGGRPSRGYAAELADLRAARDEMVAAHGGPVVLVGRSFGGRMCAFLAEQEPPAALVVLGHPIGPPGKPRPRDEAALAALACPTLVVQGERDAGQNPRVEVAVLAGAGHDFGRLEAEAIERTVDWLRGRV